MFEKIKTIDVAARQLRRITLVVAFGSVAGMLAAIFYGFNQADRAANRVYILAGDQALQALATDRKDNLLVEARAHIRNFHRLFFSLEPDEKVIRANMGQAFYLGDGSIKQQYDNLREAGYFSKIIAGNISQTVVVDSIRVVAGGYLCRWQCWATEKLVRPTTVTTRILVTRGSLRNTERSDNNPHGFLIEGLEVLDNRDLLIQNR